MEDTICRFMPEKNDTGNIKVINFVYETNLAALSQPFIRPIYYIHLVTNGNGTLKMTGCEYELKPGCVFFGFPGCPYEIKASDNFRYIYISFMGSEIGRIFENLNINYENPAYDGFDNLFEFWLSSISRIKRHNANILAESVLLYTLSFFNHKEDDENSESAENLFDMMVDYIDNHYKEHDISLKKVANVFSYTEKYISHIFKKNMKIGFNSYINKLRMKYAHELLDSNRYSVSEVALLCGYSDSMYFSKVFKKHCNATPNEYIKNRK